MTENGTLFVVATPLGNLEDLTFRARRVLDQAALVAAEDTRRTRKLLTHYGIRTRLVSYREQNHRRAMPGLLQALAEGGDVALVTDAGTPAVSDPGVLVVSEVAAAGFKISPIPGASAVAAALSVSGLSGEGHLFAGFLPARPKDRRARLDELKNAPQPLVFYESPHRLSGSLADLAAVLGPRPAVLCRELTKINEEIIRGDLAELAAWAAGREGGIKGEITLVTAGGRVEEEEMSLEELTRLIREDDRPVKALAADLAGLGGKSRNEIYRLILEIRKGSS